MRLTLAVCVTVAALAAAPSAAARTKPVYYLSLGDSYAQGYQPVGPNQADVVTNQGYTDYLYPKARRLFPGLKLMKLGCGGATTDSMINGTKRCVESHPFASTSKSTSQLTYAAKFLRRHHGHVALVTLSISGNDFASCGSRGDLAAITSCVTAGIATLKRNIPVISRTLRDAAGKGTPIIGSTYPDVALGSWVMGMTGMEVAQASVALFKQQVNPALRSAYAKRKIGFVDTTTAFGGYTPLTRTTMLAPYGRIPVAVANICTLAWYCVTRPGGPDIHLRPAGYRKLANLYLAELKRELKAARR